jgi:hypothetical protein
MAAGIHRLSIIVYRLSFHPVELLPNACQSRYFGVQVPGFVTGRKDALTHLRACHHSSAVAASRLDALAITT